MSNELSSAEDGFASYVLQLATLQLITRSAPFTHVRTLPLHIFSDLLRDYLQLLAAAAKDTAEQAGRTKISVWDVGRALDEFGTSSMADLKDDLDQNNGDSQEIQKIRTMAENLQGKRLK
jgi:histone H3/H4